MATKKNTDIKFSTIKQKAKQSHTKEKFELEDGQTITFYPVFPQTLIDEMLNEIQSIFQTKDEQIELSDELTHKYVLFMCIKYFTHLKDQLKADNFVGQLNEMKAILDTTVDNDRIDLFSLIIDEIFLPKELQKVFDKLAKFSGTFLFYEKFGQKVQEEFNKLDLKNRDVFESYANKIKSEKQIPEV